jgi:hypothetical protein
MRHYPKRTKAIGGYFELQLPLKEEYYSSLIKLNTGRNALEYVLKVNNYTNIYIPYFTCEVMLEPIKKMGLSYYFYTIDKNLEPVIDFEIAPTDCFLYTNYFGIKQDAIDRLSRQIPNLIVDNSQAFFSKPLPGIDTFYSCRKFFGVSDGAYLQSNKISSLKFEKDFSTDRMSHLLKSIDYSVEEGYQNFVENNESLERNPIKRMSSITKRILMSIDYEDCRRIRNRNFKILHEALADKNNLTLDLSSIEAPLCYPLLIEKKIVRRKLISKRIYVPTYWPNVFKWTTEKMYENYLATNLIPLPIDHRYNEEDMLRIVSCLKQITGTALSYNS